MANRKHLSTRDRLRIFEAAHGVCHLCDTKIQPGQAWEVSHPTPLEMGGPDDDTNRFPAHKTCHARETAERDIPTITRAKRRHARHIGAHRSRRPMPGSKASGLRKRMDGTVERRQ